MKKTMIAILVVLVAFSSVIAFAKPGVSGGVGDILGQAKFPSDPHKIFRLVRYVPASGSGDSATLAAESIVVWDTTSDDGVTVTTTTVSPASTVAGIIAVQALTPETGCLGRTAVLDVGKRNWTWLQTYGYAQVRVNATNAVGAGSAMGTSATAGEADIFVASTSDATKNGKAGFFYDAAAAASDDVECFLICD